jgi:cell division protein FtsL
LQVQNEQLSQKVLELQIEIEKLKSKTSEYNSETASATKYINELSAAEKKIDELENR